MGLKDWLEVRYRVQAQGDVHSVVVLLSVPVLRLMSVILLVLEYSLGINLIQTETHLLKP